MITGVVSEQEYVEAHTLHRRSIAVATNCVMVAILGVGVVLASFGVRPWGLILILGGIGGLLGEAAQARLYLPGKVRKLYAQFKGIEAPITYRWGASTFEVKSERGGGTRNWTDLHKIKENDELFLLYSTDALFEVVPKKWFESTAQMSEFRRLAKRET
jgi:YcxB-like protein